MDPFSRVAPGPTVMTILESQCADECSVLAMAALGEPARADVASSTNPVKARGMHKILVVEDDLWSALDMEWVVYKLGHEVVGPVATAQEAIALAKEAQPDLVLMDIRLADAGDGVDAAISMRQQFDITCIFVSAHADSATRSRAAAARPSDFIEKPFTPQILAIAIERSLRPAA